MMAPTVTVWLGWLVHSQIGNTAKVSQVECEHGQVVLKSGCGYQDVEVRNNLTSSPQERADLSEPAHNRFCKRQQHVALPEFVEDSKMSFWIWRLIRALVYFAKCHDA